MIETLTSTPTNNLEPMRFNNPDLWDETYPPETVSNPFVKDMETEFDHAVFINKYGAPDKRQEIVNAAREGREVRNLSQYPAEKPAPSAPKGDRWQVVFDTMDEIAAINSAAAQSRGSGGVRSSRGNSDVYTGGQTVDSSCEHVD